LISGSGCRGGELHAKRVTRLRLFDLFRVCLLSFNIQVWSIILRIQRENLCPSGAGSWSFFRIFHLRDKSRASIFVLSYCFLTVFCEWAGYLAALLEVSLREKYSGFERRRSTSWDPRIRAFAHIVWRSSSRISRFPFISVCRLSFLYKAFILVYVVVNILRSVSENGLTWKNYCTFGQIFPMVDMLGTLALLISYFTPSTVSISIGYIVRYLSSRGHGFPISIGFLSGLAGADAVFRVGDHHGVLRIVLKIV